ncbi:hypothetical protein J7L05_05400 [bacterium]|nr:hypothetical protein [bacterium]
MPVILCIILIFYVIHNFTSADHQSYCTEKNYSIFQDNNENVIILGCAGSAETCEIRIIDPVTLELLKTIPIDGLLERAISIENGETILALISEVDGLMDTQDGKLVKIDYETGDYLDEYGFPDRMAMAMSVDSSREHVYVTAGFVLEYEETPSLLLKFNIADLSVETTTVIGEIAEKLEICNDDQKLYTSYDGVKIRYDYINYRAANTEYYYEITVHQTSDLNKVAAIETSISPRTLKMGYDNRLFVGNGAPAIEGFDYALLVIDTQTDQIIGTYGFGPDDSEGINLMGLNPLSHTLYCTTFEYGHYDPEFDMVGYLPSSQILKINLDDYSHEFISECLDQKWQLAVSYDQDFCRIFCTSETAPNNVFYIDQ